jgi:hypothetical protein
MNDIKYDIMTVLDEIVQYLKDFRTENAISMHVIDNKQVVATDDYCKAWVKMSKQQRTNRIMLYVNKIRSDMSIQDTTQLKQLLLDALNSDILSDDVVDYADSQISKIKGLKCDSGRFYLDSVSAMSKKSSHVGKITFTPIDKTALSGKKTIAIKKKVS